MGITAVFVLIYALSSSLLTGFFENISFNLDLNFFNITFLLILGSVLMYAFWFFELPKSWQLVKNDIPDDFPAQISQKNNGFDLVRKSGEITFIMLNITLLLFIGIYGYENFFLPEVIETVSRNVHERVYAVIGSIVMAIGLIMFFFRGYFNFDPQNQILKKLTFGWIFLNVLLVAIALIKNMQYVSMLGLTEKRLGVFAFLLLALTGLYFTFRKVKMKKTNWFLLNRMLKMFYFTMLIVAIFNWSWIITAFNISTGKINSDLNYHFQLPHNDMILTEYLKNNNIPYYLKSRHDFTPKLDGKLYDAWLHYNNQVTKK